MVNGVLQSATVSGGAFSSSFNTAALGVAGSPYTITYSYAGDTNLSAANNTSETLTVTKAAPVFSSLSAPSIVYGAATTTLSGKISLVPNGESVSITVNGVQQSATVSGGAFSSSFNTSALGVAGSPYTITYSYVGDANLTPSQQCERDLDSDQGRAGVQFLEGLRASPTARRRPRFRAKSPWCPTARACRSWSTACSSRRRSAAGPSPAASTRRAGRCRLTLHDHLFLCGRCESQPQPTM